ncbi:MAG: transglutaminase-like domain-containing protein [Archangium sp.]
MRKSLSLLSLLFAFSAFAAEPALSDAATVKRPAEGEFMGLYLKGQKIGYMFSQVSLSPDKKTLTAVTELHFMAKVGKEVSDRKMKETRVYESKPGGKLISFLMEQSGDGGEQRLEGTTLPNGVRVMRKKPGLPNDVKMLPPSKEVVEDADQARVALKRNAKVSGTITDSTDLMQYGVATTVGETEKRTVSGVTAMLRKAITISEKEKVPTEAFVDDNGRMVEVRFGPTMTAFLEPEDVAKRVDLVEVFSLTRVTLPKPAPPEAQHVPGKFTMVLAGVPEKFWTNTYRQAWKPLGNGKVEVTVSAAAPKVLKQRPLIDPNGGVNLKSTIAVESDNPEIVKLAKQIAGDEKDAWAVARKVNAWVFNNLKKDYGASSDSATDVLALKKGDCTEHSLLSVALLRALRIPARRVDGVVYLMNDDNVPALYWHEWVEAYVGEWTQLDPTFGQDIAHPARLAVGEESNAEITPLIGAMQVTEVR